MAVKPIVSVVIPCWNARRWIGRAITSVLNQQISVEIIVVNDGSTDNSIEVIDEFRSVRVFTTENRGAVYARNLGLRCSESRWVLFLDADDYLASDSLKHWVDAGERTDADTVIGPFAFESGAVRSLGRRAREPASGVSVLCDWLEGWFTPPCAIVWKRDFLNSIGAWNPEAQLRGDDAELVMRAMIMGAKVATVYEGLGIYVQHDSPDRISKRTGPEVLSCEFDFTKNLWSLAKRNAMFEAQRSFSHAFYRLAYQAYALGYNSQGEVALKISRDLGFRGHIGSTTHKVFAGLLGLRTKMWCGRCVRGFASNISEV